MSLQVCGTAINISFLGVTNSYILCPLSSEEKSEALVECKEDLEHNKLLVAKLRQEVTCTSVHIPFFSCCRSEDYFKTRALFYPVYRFKS